MGRPHAAADSPRPDAGTVTVVGTGRAGSAPDTLVLDLRLEGRGATVAEALDDLTRASRACHDALADLPLRTHGLGVHPRHDHGTGDVVGHTAHQSMQVRTDDPAGAGQLVRRLSQVAGEALTVGGLRAEVSGTRELEGRARELAFADARARADQYAVLTDRAVVGARHVRELDGPDRPFPLVETRAALAGGPVVDAADLEVTVSVEVVWELGG